MRPDRLGDCIVSSALLADVRCGQEKANFVWCVPEAFLPLWEKAPYPILALEALPDFCRKEKANGTPIKAVFLNPKREIEAQLCGCEVFSWGKTLKDHRKRCEKPEAAYAAELLRAAGLEAQTGLPQLFPATIASSSFAKPYVLFHVGAHGRKASLPPTLIEELTLLLGERGIKAIWLGVDQTQPDFRNLAERAQRTHTRTLGSRLPIKELLAWIAGAKAILGRDSGIAHLAGALGVPTVALVGPVAKTLALRRWAVRGAHTKNLELQINPRWYETDKAYQARYFGCATSDPFLHALDELWH